MSDTLPHAFKFVNKFYRSVLIQLVNTFVSIPIRHNHFSFLSLRCFLPKQI